MAKVRGGLFSLSADGQLAKTLVYSKWKGIQYAREYVTPANPRTAGQVAQRESMAEAIAYWQLPELVQGVRDAFRRAAARLARTMSGANLATRSFLAFKKAEADSNIALSGIVLYGGADAANMDAVTIATPTGTIGCALSLNYTTTGTKLTITGAADNAGEIVKNRSLEIVANIPNYNFIRVVGVTTDGATTIDLTGIVQVSDIPVA